MTRELTAGAGCHVRSRAGGILALAGVLAMVCAGCTQPQLDNDPELFKTVDALFTALTSRDLSRIDDCESRLDEFYESGQLTPAAGAILDAVIEEARDGDWERAAQRLYDFMLAQRRR